MEKVSSSPYMFCGWRTKQLMINTNNAPIALKTNEATAYFGQQK